MLLPLERQKEMQPVPQKLGRRAPLRGAYPHYMIIRSTSYKEKERILSAALLRAKPLLQKEEFTGSGVAPFIGRIGYPHVNVGFLAPQQTQEDAWKHDAPRHWAATNTAIQDVVNYRTTLVNSKLQTNVKTPDKFVSLAQELALSSKPVNIDVSLEKKPTLSLTPDQWTAPMGPNAQLKKLTLASTPHIPTRVQKYFDDTDAFAAEALTSLYSHEIDENSLSRMLSVGAFGKKRKLVPTRWSITATDDILANSQLEKVRDMPISSDFIAYFGSYLGNYYLILCLPREWSYELFEIYVQPNKLEYSTDYEEHSGRTTYSEQCAGGYYAARLALSEHLIQLKRQNTIIAIRFITNEYLLPLGVWVTREATRKALQSTPIKFASKELLITYARNLAKKKFGIELEPLIQKSKLLKEKQEKINKFFN